MRRRGSRPSSRRSRRSPPSGPDAAGAAGGAARHRGAGRRRAGRRAGPAPPARRRAGRSSRPRLPGRRGTSWRCRSTTSWRAGCGWHRSCPIAAQRSRRASPTILGAELGWGDARQALEVQTYLASARREFGVPPPGGPSLRPTAVGARGRLTAGRHRHVMSAAHGWPHERDRRSRAPVRDLLYPLRVPIAIGLARGVRRRCSSSPAGAAGSRPPAASRPDRGRRRRRAGDRRCRSAWYLASPLFIRTELIEPAPIAVAAASPASTPVIRAPTPVAIGRSGARRRRASRPPTARRRRPAPTPFVADLARAGTFHGADDFHFGEGTRVDHRDRAWRYTLRFEDVLRSQWPGPVRLPVAGRDGYAEARSSSGTLKATDGAFGYELPGGHGSGRVRERRDLVQAVRRPVRGGAAGGRLTQDLGAASDSRKSGLCKAKCTAYYPARKCHGSVRGQNVARRNSDSSHG